jgi:3-deoxy-manno-octulosonate cytidylyltransferase (CMP-KDO synthetase)
MRVLIVVPARYASSRYPGKPLVPLAGAGGQARTLIERSWEAAMAVRGADRVVVATDDGRIRDHAVGFGAEVVMTSAGCRNGTERCAEAHARLGGSFDIVVNLQGDEPLIEPGAIEAVIGAMAGGVRMATLARPLAEGELERPQVVKVVTRASGDALYFSRAPIPHRRAGGESALARAHVGIYAFTAAFLETFTALAPGRLEGEEALEQLRALEHGYDIRVADTGYRGFGIDTPEDLERARALLAAGA